MNSREFCITFFVAIWMTASPGVYGEPVYPVGQNGVKEYPKESYIQGELLIKFKDDAVNESTVLNLIQAEINPNQSINQIERVNTRFGNTSSSYAQHNKKVRNQFLLRSKRNPSMRITVPSDVNKLFRVRFQNEKIPLGDVVRQLRRNPAIEYVEPNYILDLDYISNDEYFNSEGAWGQAYGDLWGLKKIEAPVAWDVTQGAGITVAVLDSGVDYNHPDMFANMFINVSEKNGAVSVDDDGNGFIDDVYGYDFINEDGDPMDDHRHGTHVAGTIAAVGDNKIGIVGVAPKSKIMAIKVGNSSGKVPSSAIAKGLYYATDMGADVVNMSFTGEETKTVSDAIQYATAHGVVLVAAAGNDGLSAGDQFPANSRYTIAVGASSSEDQMADFSNWGWRIDVAAPGGDSSSAGDLKNNILSLRSGIVNKPEITVPPPDGQYLRMRGTSMAAPHVSGAAAILLSKYPEAPANQIKQAIKLFADPVIDTNDFGRLNIAKSLNKFGSACVGMILKPTSDQIIVGDDMNIQFMAEYPNDIDTSHFILRGGNGLSMDPKAMQLLKSGKIKDDIITLKTSIKDVEGPYTILLEVYDAVYGTLCATDRVVFNISHMVADVTIQGSTNAFGSSLTQMNGIYGPDSKVLVIADKGALVDLPVSKDIFWNKGAVYIIKWNDVANGYHHIADANINKIKITGENDEDVFGFSISGTGDIDGDGIDDLLVSAPYYKCDNGVHCGKIYLILGSDLANQEVGSTVAVASLAKYSWIGNELHPLIGADVKYIGDADGDKLSDFAFVNSVHSKDPNKLSLLMNVVFSSNMSTWTPSMDMSTTAQLQISDATSYLLDTLISFSEIGDYSGDGLADVLIGHSTYHKAFVQEIHKTSIVQPPFLNLIDGSSGGIFDNFGSFVIGDCDINGDFVSDIIVYQNGQGIWNINGALHIYNGIDKSGQSSKIIPMTAGTMNFYNQMTCVKDYNGDGMDDVVFSIGKNLFLMPGKTKINEYTIGTPREMFLSWPDLASFTGLRNIAASLDLNGDLIGDIGVGSMALESVFINYGHEGAMIGGMPVITELFCDSGINCITEFDIGGSCNDSNSFTINDKVNEKGFCSGEICVCKTPPSDVCFETIGKCHKNKHGIKKCRYVPKLFSRGEAVPRECLKYFGTK